MISECIRPATLMCYSQISDILFSLHNSEWFFCDNTQVIVNSPPDLNVEFLDGLTIRNGNMLKEMVRN